MAEESNVHVKVAMAEVLGCFLIATVAILIAMFGLKVTDDLGTIVALAPWIGWGLLVCTVVAYVNENLLLTAIFGPLAVFLLAFPDIAIAALAGVGGLLPAAGGTPGAVIVGFIGVALLVDAIVSMMQPIRILSILLFVAAIAFFVMAVWWNDLGTLTTSDLRVVLGFVWFLVAALAAYIGAAVAIFVVKGAPLLPLFISKAPAKA